MAEESVRKYGPRLGFVRDRRDPEMRGCVRVYVPSDNNVDIPRNWTDWCERKSAFHAVPPLGAAVWVEYEMGDMQSAVYSWGPAQTASNVPAAGREAQDPNWIAEHTVTSGGFGATVAATLPADPAKTTVPDYPYDKVFTSESGHTLELDDTPGALRARYHHPSGTSILIDPDGSVQIRSVGAQYHRCGGDFVVALDEGSTFKVIYEGGGALAVGAQGVILSGHQVQLLNRTVVRDPKGA